MHRWEREWNARRDDNSLVPDLRPFRTTFSRSNPTRIERKRFRWRVMSFPDLSGLRCVRTTYKDAPISVYAHACTRDGCIASWIGSPRLYYSWAVILGQATSGCSPLPRIQYDAGRDGNNAWTSDRWNSSRSIASPNDIPCHLTLTNRATISITLQASPHGWLLFVRCVIPVE